MPMRPPISACDELDGIPARHVIRFHAIAPTSAAMIMPSAGPPRGATSEPIVLATRVCSSSIAMIAPARFSTADAAMAAPGRMALVLIEVATAFAVSWNPLVKSNPSAIAIVTTSSGVCPSGMLDDDILDDRGNVLAAVQRVLEQRVDVLELDHRERVIGSAEQLVDRQP